MINQSFPLLSFCACFMWCLLNSGSSNIIKSVLHTRRPKLTLKNLLRFAYVTETVPRVQICRWYCRLQESVEGTWWQSNQNNSRSFSSSTSVPLDLDPFKGMPAHPCSISWGYFRGSGEADLKCYFAFLFFFFSWKHLFMHPQLLLGEAKIFHGDFLAKLTYCFKSFLPDVCLAWAKDAFCEAMTRDWIRSYMR